MNDTASPPGWFRWGRRALAALAALVLLYALIGFLVLPAVLQARLPVELSRILGRPVRVARVRANPFALSLTVDGFAVRERDGAAFLGWDRLYLRLDAATLVTRALAFRAVELVHPYGEVVVARDGRMNFADIAARLNAPAPTGATPAAAPAREVRIGHLAIQGGKVQFLDQSLAAPFATTLGPLSLDLEGFSTGPDRRSPYRFTGRTEAGESFRWAGSLSLAPLAARGSFTLEHLRLAKYQPFFQDQVAFRVLDGRVSARAGYDLQWSSGVHRMRLDDGALELERLSLAPAGLGVPQVLLPRLTATGVQADLIARRVELAALDLEGGKLSLTRAGDGTLDLVRLFTPRPGPAPAAPAAPFQVRLREVNLKGFQVAFRDQVPARPVQLQARDLDLALREVTLDPAVPVRLRLGLKLDAQSSLAAEGTVSPLRPAADLQVRLDHLDLAPLDPYLAPDLDVRVNRGRLSLTGRLQGSFQGQPADAVRFQGALRLDQFEVADGSRREPFLGYRALALAGLDVDTRARTLRIRSVDLVQPAPRLVVAADGSTNVGRALRLEQAPVTRPLAAAGAVLPPSQGEPFHLAVQRTRVTGGRLSFVDRSLEPNAALLITDLEGSATSLSTEPDTQAALDFRGLAGGLAPLRIQGRAMPLRKDQDTDVTLTLHSAPLSDFNPYTLKYLGYPVRKGNLDVEARVRIQARQLQALLKTRLDQFFLGERQPGPDAVHVPVKLCLAILRDRHGVIEVELPVDGSLDDPDLHYGRIVWQAVLNLLGKVAASPFTLLAHLAGGSQEHDLSFVAFEPGSADPDPVAATKAQSLARALADRPELSLEVEGTADPALDAGALKRQALERELQALRAEAQPAAAADGAVPPAERTQWLRAAFQRTFKAEAGAAPSAELEQRLLGAFPVTGDDLGELGRRRAQAMLRLLRQAQVEPTRLFPVSGGQAATQGGSRVYFGLK